MKCCACGIKVGVDRFSIPSIRLGETDAVTLTIQGEKVTVEPVDLLICECCVRMCMERIEEMDRESDKEGE